MTTLTTAHSEALNQIAELTAENERLQRLAYTDELTGIGNRAALTAHANAQSQRPTNGDVHLFVIDLDDFKRVNDTKGHEAGDQVLQQVAKHLSRRTMPGLAYRLGGDEFVLIVPSHKVELVAQHLALSPHPVSYGHVPFTGDLGQTLQQADMKMYEHKQSKGARSADRRARANR